MSPRGRSHASSTAREEGRSGVVASELLAGRFGSATGGSDVVDDGGRVCLGGVGVNEQAGPVPGEAFGDSGSG